MGSLEFTPFAGQRAFAVGDDVHRVEMTSRSPSPPPSTPSSGPSGPRRVPLTRESPSPHPSTSSVASTSSEDSEVLGKSSAVSSSTSISTAASGEKDHDGAALPKGIVNGTPNGTPNKSVNGTPHAAPLRAITPSAAPPKSINGTANAAPPKLINGTANGAAPKKAIHAASEANGNSKAKAAPKEHTLSDPSDVDLEWPQLPSSRPPGLFNPSMACYSNATLQMLLHTPPLLNLVRAHDPRTCQLTTRNAFCMTCALRSVAQEHWSGKKKAYKPQAVQGNLGRIKKGFSPRRQEDAHEFLRFVTDGLQNSALAGLPKNLPEKVKCTSLVYRALGGRVRSRVLCLSCKKPSDTFDQLLDLSLDIPRNAADLHDLFQHYIHKERLDGDNKYKCENCKKKSAATKQLQIEDAPPVLTLHLKRFGFNWQGQSKKISKHIAFGPLLDIGPYMVDKDAAGTFYRLLGVVCHHGYGPHSGHYTSYVRSPEGKWFEADDEDVRQVTFQKVRGDQSAYVLSYGRLSPEEIADIMAKREAKKAGQPVSPVAKVAPPPSPGKRQREDDGTPMSTKRVMPAPTANGTPMSANGTPKANAVLKLEIANAVKTNGTPTASSSLGKHQRDEDEETPPSNQRISTPTADDTPRANGHANGSPKSPSHAPIGALARLANYGSSDAETEESPLPGPMPGAFGPSVPTSPRPHSAPLSPKKRKHKTHHADPKRGLHGVSKGAPMPFAVGKVSGKNTNMRTNGMLGPKGSATKREAQLGRQKGVLKRMQGR